MLPKPVTFVYLYRQKVTVFSHFVLFLLTHTIYICFIGFCFCYLLGNNIKVTKAKKGASRRPKGNSKKGLFFEPALDQAVPLVPKSGWCVPVAQRLHDLAEASEVVALDLLIIEAQRQG